jgi:hypothetical protein
VVAPHVQHHLLAVRHGLGSNTRQWGAVRGGSPGAAGGGAARAVGSPGAARGGGKG